MKKSVAEHQNVDGETFVCIGFTRPYVTQRDANVFASYPRRVYTAEKYQ